jgi:hypothetical protein
MFHDLSPYIVYNSSSSSSFVIAVKWKVKRRRIFTRPQHYCHVFCIDTWKIEFFRRSVIKHNFKYPTLSGASIAPTSQVCMVVLLPTPERWDVVLIWSLIKIHQVVKDLLGRQTPECTGWMEMAPGLQCERSLWWNNRIEHMNCVGLLVMRC